MEAPLPPGELEGQHREQRQRSVSVVVETRQGLSGPVGRCHGPSTQHHRHHKVLGVSASGFHASQSRRPSQRTQQEARLEIEIRAAHQTYGPERLQRDLAAHGGMHRGPPCQASSSQAWVEMQAAA
jgi:hypothetical protein